MNARTAGGQLLNFTFDDITNGYIISEIEGLGPVKASFSSSNFASVDGVQHQSARRGQRDLVIKLELEPDYITQTVESLRLALYDYFMTKSVVELEFVSDSGITARTIGHVETCEPVIFAESPTMEIGVVCDDPDFFEPVPIVVNANTVSTTVNTPVIYTGSSATGITLAIKPARAVADLTLWHTAPGGVQQSLEFGSPLEINDTLTITTTPGKKTAMKKTSTNILTSALYGVSPTSSWPMLVKGTNQIRLVTSGDPIPYTIEYVKKYGGL